VQAASSQPFQVKVAGILENHGRQGKAVGANPAEEPVEGFQFTCTIGVFLGFGRAGSSVLRFGALPFAGHERAVLFGGCRLTAAAFCFVRASSFIRSPFVAGSLPLTGRITPGGTAPAAAGGKLPDTGIYRALIRTTDTAGSLNTGGEPSAGKIICSG